MVPDIGMFIVRKGPTFVVYVAVSVLFCPAPSFLNKIVLVSNCDKSWLERRFDQLDCGPLIEIDAGKFVPVPQLLLIVLTSVADPVGSEPFGRIRIRIRP